MKVYTVYWSFETEDTPDGYEIKLNFSHTKEPGMRDFTFNEKDIDEYWDEAVCYCGTKGLSNDIADLEPGQLEPIFCEYLNGYCGTGDELLEPLYDEAERLLEEERKDLQFGV